MNNMQTIHNQIINKIYSSINKHYKDNNLSVQGLIERDTNNSKYIKNDINKKNDNSLYKRLVYSIHNANWKAVSIESFWRKSSSNYEKALKSYDSAFVSSLTINELRGKGIINSDKKIQYIINAAKFVEEIKKHSKSGVISFFDKFAYEGSSVYERWALVSIIASSVNGISNALACDLLKEIGYMNYGKPDVHIKRILERIGIIKDLKNKLVYKKSKEDYFIFRILDILALNSKKTLFEVDKILWLFGTGFDNSSGKAIGGICSHTPKCNKCLLNGLCNYYKTGHGKS